RQLVGGEAIAGQPERTDRAEYHVYADPGEQRRVGENAYTVRIDQDDGMSEPRERDGIVGLRTGAWSVGRRLHVAPDFGHPIPQESRRPGRRGTHPGSGAAGARHGAGCHEGAPVEDAASNRHFGRFSVTSAAAPGPELVKESMGS